MTDGGQRHSMVTVAPSAWAAVMAARPDLAVEPLIAGWALAGWPLIMRRPACGDCTDAVPLGLPLPPSHGKRRLALSLPVAGLSAPKPPPLLAEAAVAAPRSWRPAIERLIALDDQTRCFGSLAWQHMTGLPYLSTGSDLDLLWPLPQPAAVEHFLAGVATIAQTAPMSIDGEILGPAGGVQWRELRSGMGETLIIKGLQGLHSLSRADFLTGISPL